MDNEKIILSNSPDAATYKENLSGWVSRTGRFWGKDGHMAKWDGATHTKCRCGIIFPKNSYCKTCAEKRRLEKFKAKPVMVWNGKDALYSDSEDRYYGEWEGVNNEDRKVSFESMNFIICERTEWRELSDDFFEDSLCEDVGNDELIDLIHDFNENLKEIQTNCWEPGLYRAVLEEE